ELRLESEPRERVGSRPERVGGDEQVAIGVASALARLVEPADERGPFEDDAVDTRGLEGAQHLGGGVVDPQPLCGGICRRQPNGLGCFHASEVSAPRRTVSRTTASSASPPRTAALAIEPSGATTTPDGVPAIR